MMRSFLLILILALSVGCGTGVNPMPGPTAIKGKLELSSGKPASGLIFNLYPLEGQHPGVYEVAEDGTFKGEAISGKYSYFVTKGSAKNSEQSLKLVNPKLREPDLTRTIVVKAGEDISIKLE